MKRTRKVADHVITFYLRCLKSANKMPLEYGFYESTTKIYQLIRCIKEWLINISKSGLIFLTIICDQGGSNVSAVQTLISETNKIRTLKNLSPSRYSI